VGIFLLAASISADICYHTSLWSFAPD